MPSLCRGRGIGAARRGRPGLSGTAWRGPRKRLACCIALALLARHGGAGPAISMPALPTQRASGWLTRGAHARCVAARAPVVGVRFLAVVGRVGLASATPAFATSTRQVLAPSAKLKRLGAGVWRGRGFLFDDMGNSRSTGARPAKALGAPRARCACPFARQAGVAGRGLCFAPASGAGLAAGADSSTRRVQPPTANHRTNAQVREGARRVGTQGSPARRPARRGQPRPHRQPFHRHLPVMNAPAPAPALRARTHA